MKKDVEEKEEKQIKVSVITTFYNAENFILNAIHSVGQQVLPQNLKVEYVIVDDKSPDKSREIVEQYIKSCKNNGIEFKLVEPEQNLGCGGARKFGIANASGDYFMFLDADDYYIRRDFVKRAVETIIGENADIVEYGMVFNQANGTQTQNCVREKIVVQDPSVAEVLLFKDNAIKFNVWTKIYTRAIVESYPYSEERLFEDVRTIPVWVSNAKKIVIMPSAEVNYRAASGSIIRDDMIKTRLGTISGIASLFERFKNDKRVLKAMYGRAMVDLTAMLNGHSSNNKGFNEMSRLNTYMLKYIYPNTWQNITYNVEDDPDASPYREED